MGQFYAGVSDQLTLHVRHLAWLQARPRVKNMMASQSRLAAFQAREEAGGVAPLLELPPVETGEHLLGYLFQIGPGVDGKPITFQEIGAWVDLTGAVLSSWEASTLHALSVAYMAEYGQADEPDRPPPYTSAVQVNRAAVSQARREFWTRMEAHDARNT